MYPDTYFHLQLQNFLKFLDSGWTLPDPAVFTNRYQPALPQHVWLRHLISGQTIHLCRASGVITASKPLHQFSQKGNWETLKVMGVELFKSTCDAWSSANMRCNKVDEANKKVSWQCKQCRFRDLRIILSPNVHLCPMEQHAAVDGPD